MKEKRKTFVLGFLTAVIVIVLAIPVLAAGTLQTWNDVMVGGITIEVDGEVIEPKDANGNTVEPAIYEGTTYLPVRAIATTLGMEVAWDGSTKTVILKSNGEGEPALASPQPTDEPNNTEESTTLTPDMLKGIWYRDDGTTEAEYVFTDEDYYFASHTIMSDFPEPWVFQIIPPSPCNILDCAAITAKY